jgi:hypothetical protein
MSRPPRTPTPDPMAARFAAVVSAPGGKRVLAAR